MAARLRTAEADEESSSEVAVRRWREEEGGEVEEDGEVALAVPLPCENVAS